MREIKFRAWDKRFQRMHSPFVELGTDKYLANFPMPLNEQPLPQNTVFMQYTGLKDKNGIEIYEGDILPSLGIPLVVEYEMARFVARNGEDVAFNFSWKDMEVVGNIYANPELLERVI